MKYSVLMSVYHRDDPEYLKQALESVYEHQTRKPDEIVVVFDGPLTDGLYAVLEHFREGKEQVVSYYPQEENRGLGAALRVGSVHCTGDYIFRMDSDDISHPERFALQAAWVEKHPEVDVLGGNIAEFHNVPEEEHLRVRACPPKHEDIARMGRRRNPMNHVTVCIRRAALEQCGYESLLLVEDYYLWLRMMAAGYKLANLDQTMVYVRVGNGFYNRRGARTQIRSWKTLQSFMVKHGMIGRADALMNMIYIVGFTCCPGKIRKFVYDKLLRR